MAERFFSFKYPNFSKCAKIKCKRRREEGWVWESASMTETAKEVNLELKRTQGPHRRTAIKSAIISSIQFPKVTGISASNLSSLGHLTALIIESEIFLFQSIA